LFYAAAAQAFILKTVTLIAAVAYLGIYLYAKDKSDDDATNCKWFWKICFLPMFCVLYGSQLFACKIQMRKNNALLGDSGATGKLSENKASRKVVRT
jgi:hypothetical protein